MLDFFRESVFYFRKIKFYIFFGILLVVTFISTSHSIAQTNTINISACGVLDQVDTEYILQNDVTSDGTCFSVQANDIKLNLNGHTITYSNASVISVTNGDFEYGSGTNANFWNQNSSSGIQRRAGTFVDPVSLWSGSYAMAVDLPASDQSIISESSVIIPANKTYAISAMVRNNFYNGPNAYIQIEDSAGNVLARKNITNTRGALGLNAVEYKPNVDTAVFIRLGINNGATSQSGTIYFDDVQVHPVADHAVSTSACYAPSQYDNPCGGSAANMQVTNGDIVQGVANSYSGHAINLNQGPNTNGVQIDNLNITIQGPNSTAVNTAYKSNLNIHHNTINNNVTAIVSRHNMDGATIRLGGSSSNSQVHNNTIIGGPQGGILFPRSSSNTGNSAYNNDISQNGRYSNDFGIYAWGDDMLIYGNNIHPSSGRGIHVDGANNDIYDNIITVRELKQNQEYNGCELGGSYGIQLEGGRTINNKIHGNTVTAYADDCDGLALRATNVSANDNEIYGNIFSAVRVGNTAANANASSFAETTGAMDIHNNTFIADSYFVHVYWDGATGTTFRSNTFRKGTNLANNMESFFFSTTGETNFIFRDSIFENGASDVSIFSNILGSPAWAGATSYIIEQTLNLTVNDQSGNPINGASVSISDTLSQNEFSGTTNSNGIQIIPLKQFSNGNTTSQAAFIQTFTPHSITVSMVGYISQTISLNMNQTRSLTVSMQADGSDPQACIPTWNCGDWSTCTNDIQSRTCADINSCGDNSAKPIETQSCTEEVTSDPQACIPTWNCGDWSACGVDTQTRTCVDVYSCGVDTNKPVESQSCISENSIIGDDDSDLADDINDDTPNITSNNSGSSGASSSNNSTPNIPSSNSGGGSLACRDCTYVRGSLLVLENTNGAAVYHIGKDGKKYIFPDAKTYFTWNRDFVRVKKVSLSVLDDYPDGGAMAYRGGTKLITHQNTARVYAVEPGGILRWIPSEIIAKKLYGESWQLRVQDIDPGLFSISYTRGDDLSDKLPSGSLVKYNNDYYYIDGSTKRKFDTLSILGANGFKVEDAISVDTLSAYTRAVDISAFDESAANYL